MTPFCSVALSNPFVGLGPNDQRHFACEVGKVGDGVPRGTRPVRPAVDTSSTTSSVAGLAAGTV